MSFLNLLFHKSTIKAMKRRKTILVGDESPSFHANGGGDGDNNKGSSSDSNNNGQQQQQPPRLRRTLTAIDLILYGIGSSVGAGIFVLVGL